MKETCMNCAYFSGCLVDETNDCHIHNYCFAWKREMVNLFHSEVNTITNNLCDLTNKICMYDDVETGDASCYRFKPSNPYIKDEFFENNKKENIKILLQCIDDILEDDLLDRETLLELKNKYMEKMKDGKTND